MKPLQFRRWKKEMRSLNAYLAEYQSTHQNPTNRLIHKFCVPLILWSVIAFADSFSILGPISVGHLLVVLALGFYAALKDIFSFFAMVAFMAGLLFSCRFIPNIIAIASAVFLLAWIGQFYGHHLEGRRPAFFTDIFFLLIGPLWVIKSLISPTKIQ